MTQYKAFSKFLWYIARGATVTIQAQYTAFRRAVVAQPRYDSVEDAQDGIQILLYSLGFESSRDYFVHIPMERRNSAITLMATYANATFAIHIDEAEFTRHSISMLTQVQDATRVILVNRARQVPTVLPSGIHDILAIGPITLPFTGISFSQNENAVQAENQPVSDQVSSGDIPKIRHEDSIYDRLGLTALQCRERLPRHVLAIVDNVELLDASERTLVVRLLYQDDPVTTVRRGRASSVGGTQTIPATYQARSTRMEIARTLA